VKQPLTPADVKSIEEARAIADGALQSVRHLSRLLHPPMLDDMGLPATLRWFLDGFTERTGIATDFVEAGLLERPSAEIETCVYRIIQEATTNIVRHSAATNCRVYLQRLPSTILLTVEDNGRGFDVNHLPANSQAGFGLLGIRERVAGFRGTFRLESRVGHGTRLTVELPTLGRDDATSGGEPDTLDPMLPSKERPDDSNPAG
jgi:signal transduction histidine kinase